jgi:hypothetical protein
MSSHGRAANQMLRIEHRLTDLVQSFRKRRQIRRTGVITKDDCGSYFSTRPRPTSGSLRIGLAAQPVPKLEVHLRLWNDIIA